MSEDVAARPADEPGGGDPPEAPETGPEAGIEPDDVLDGELVPTGPEDDGPEVPLADGGGVLLKQDLLSRYMAEVARYERLTPEAEHELALAWHEEGDQAAAARLVTSHLRLVVSIALSFRRAFTNVLDLIQEGNVGLIEAVQRFDPLKGTRLSTYATWWIRSRIVRYLLDNWRLVRVGTTNARRKLLFNLRDEKARLEAQGIVPTPKRLAARLGTSTEDVIAVDQALGARDVSLDLPATDDGGSPRSELLPGPSVNPEAAAAGTDFLERFHAVIDDFAQGLKPREEMLLRERLLADEPLTLQDIADREGVTREAVRQSEKRLVDRLRETLRERLPEAEDIQFLREQRD
ncbi:MAG: sigma-70 family RNA polymerase sigma factor [Acidobacteriota bacterium]